MTTTCELEEKSEYTYADVSSNTYDFPAVKICDEIARGNAFTPTLRLFVNGVNAISFNTEPAVNTDAHDHVAEPKNCALTDPRKNMVSPKLYFALTAPMDTDGTLLLMIRIVAAADEVSPAALVTYTVSDSVVVTNSPRSSLAGLENTDELVSLNPAQLLP